MPTTSLLVTELGDMTRRTGCCLPGVGISSCGACSGPRSATLTALSKLSTAMSSTVSRSTRQARWLTRKSSLRHPHFPRRQGEPTGDNVAVISKAFRELTGMRRSLRTITPDQLGLFREDSAQRESWTNQSGPHVPAATPFGVVTRMVALWRASATNANDL